jgi:hypothetical protein
MLSALYILIAFSFYYYPDSAAGGLDKATSHNEGLGQFIPVIV